MVSESSDRSALSALKGWLSDVYFPSLLEVTAREQALSALATRLGPKSTVDDPLHGRAAGMPGVRAHLDATAMWLEGAGASYTRAGFTQGVDRDVTEGTLALTVAGKALELPVAVVAERRKSREVEVRVYFAAQVAGGDPSMRKAFAAPAEELVLAQPIDALFAALAKADLAAVGATFEEEGAVRDARGGVHPKKEGALASFFQTLVAGGTQLQLGGVADDLRTGAIEITVTRANARAALFVVERGDSGLLRSLRIYGDLEG